MTSTSVDNTTVPSCDCSDLQIDLVGCECGGEPRRRPTVDERIAEIDRLEDEAVAREQRAEAAHWEAEFARDLARGWAWDPTWGVQPMDEHVRASLAHQDASIRQVA